MRSDSMLSFRNVLLFAAILLIVHIGNAPAQTPQIQVVHNFAGKPSDGTSPTSGVRFDNAGNLYGTTPRGGTYDGGTIYKIANDGTESVLYSFNGIGPNPSLRPINIVGVVVDPDTGDLYGTTDFGGDLVHCIYGCGEIFKLSPDGTFIVLHAFNPSQDGNWPSRLVRDSQGNLYGTNELGGPGDGGTVFEYSADGTFSVLYSFQLADVFYRPLGPVVRDNQGDLYGITRFYNTPLGTGGAIFKLAADGSLYILHSFDVPFVPTSLVSDDLGNLYGTAVSQLKGGDGSHMAFELALDGTFKTLYLFPQASLDAPSNVNVLLPVAGNLYGTGYGISGYTGGTLFEIGANGRYSVLSRFTNRTGAEPTDRLTLWSGRLYGGAAAGGTYNHGTIFSFGVPN